MDSNLSPSSSVEQKQNPPSLQQSRKIQLLRFVITMFADIALPLAIYFILQNHMNHVYALILSGTPPFIMVIIKAIINRAFDALGCIVCIGFILSAIIGITTEDPTLLLLGQSLVTGVIGLIFGITLIPFYRCHPRFQLRPLVYYFYQDLAPITREQLGLPESIFKNEENCYQENQTLISGKEEAAKVYEWLYTNCSSFRRSCFIVTLIWFTGLFFGFLGQLILILLHSSTDVITIYGRVALSVIMVVCTLLSILRGYIGRKQTMVIIETWKKEHLNIQ